MLSKLRRLNLKKDFKWVATGLRVETKYLKLFVKLGENQTPKMAVAVSSQSFKKATERNRAKRVTFAAFETIYKNLPTGMNIVALPKVGVIGVKSKMVLLDLEKRLREQGILK